MKKKFHRKVIIVSACLLGINYKYNGNNNFRPEIIELLSDRLIKPVCPEVDGGLNIPRPPAEIKNGDGFKVLAGESKVINKDGEDVTEYYISGSRAILNGLSVNRIHFAIMKARSPACGSKKIYSGDFSNHLKKGVGVGSAILLENGIKVYNEEELEKLKKYI